MKLYSTVNSDTRLKTVFFMGNSLMYRDGNTPGGRRFSHTIYSSLITTKQCNVQNYSVGGITTTTMIANFPTVLAPYLKEGDIVFFWEWLNDLVSGGQDPAGAYANGQTYTALCRAKGAKVIVATTTPTAIVGAETECLALNTLILANNNVSWDATVDLRIENFQTLADCSDLTYYLADEIHHTSTGTDLLAVPVAAAILPFL